MKEEFEYGELVEVRDNDNEEWDPRHYIGTMPKCKLHWTVQEYESIHTFEGIPEPWRQIRKLQKPEPEPLFISTQGVFTAEEAVMQLQERIEKILEELKELKTQLK